MTKREYVQLFFEKPDRYLKQRFSIQIRKKIIFELLKTIKHVRVLDVGCGDGSLTIDLLKESKVTFLDSSKQMLEILKKRIIYNDRAEVVLASIEDYNPAEKFDLIICVGVVAHLESIPITLFKLKEMLANNGHLIIQFTNHNKFLNKLYYLNKTKNKFINRTNEKMMSEIFSDVGLKVERQVQYGLLLRGMGKLPNRFLYYMQSIFIDSHFFKPLLMENMVLLSKA